MLSITTKREYWSWIEGSIASPKDHTLKDIQDTFILSLLKSVKGKRILEVGGGVSRVAQHLAQNNEVWLVDGFEGNDGGPTAIPELPGVKVVVGYMGQYLKELPVTYFDFVFSISVIEHVVAPRYSDCFKDISRVLARGGQTIHAIDLYLYDDPNECSSALFQQSRLGLYLDTPNLVGGALKWKEPPEVTKEVRASAKFAFNSMNTLLGWNNIVPSLKEVRTIALSCSAEMILEKV